MKRILFFAGLVAMGAAIASPASAQFDMGSFRTLTPRCIPASEAQGALWTQGYRNTRVVGRSNGRTVTLIESTPQGQYRIVFDLCRGEVDSREAL